MTQVDVKNMTPSMKQLIFKQDVLFRLGTMTQVDVKNMTPSMKQLIASRRKVIFMMWMK